MDGNLNLASSIRVTSFFNFLLKFRVKKKQAIFHTNYNLNQFLKLWIYDLQRIYKTEMELGSAV